MVAHEQFTGSRTTLLAKKFIDFVFGNDPLNTDLSKLVRFDDNSKRYDSSYESKSCAESIENNRRLAGHKKLVSNIKYSDLFNKREKMFRLCFINYFGIKHLKYTGDASLILFLENDDTVSKGWQNVTLTEIRNHCDRPEVARFWKS